MWRSLGLLLVLGCAGAPRVLPDGPIEAPVGLESDAAAALLARLQAIEVDLADGRDALSRDDANTASAHLHAAADGLHRLGRDLPAADLLRALDDLGARLQPGEHAPIDTRILEERTRGHGLFLEPSVIAGVGRSMELIRDGRPALAFDALGEARATLARDLSRSPIEGAFTAVHDAAAAADRGEADLAGELLAPAFAHVSFLQNELPLLPVRFDLRAAAATAELGRWQRSGEFLARAERRLASLSSVASAPLRAEADRLRVTAAELRAQVDGKERPAPGRIRRLAAAAGTPSLG